MFPGQRTSRRTKNLENMGTLDDDGFDDFGIPTTQNRKARGSVSSGKKGLFGRMRRGSSSNAGMGDEGGDSDEEAGSFDVIPGLPTINQLSDQYSNNPYGGTPQMGAASAPYGLDSVHPSASPVQGRPGPSGEISMDQISSLRDRHRYPAMDEDPVNGRAMSLTSMSNYDTTPIIPTIGPTHNFQSAHNKAPSQHDNYRQRMIESRRALLSSETGIPITGNANGKPAADPSGAPPRTMSMGSMTSMGSHHSQMPGTPGRVGPMASPRTNTMNGQMMAPGPPLMSPGAPPTGPYYNGPPHMGPQGVPHPNGPMMRPGLGVQVQRPVQPNMYVPPTQYSAAGPQLSPYPNVAGGPPQQPQYQPQYQGQYLAPQHAQGNSMAPPIATPNLNDSSHEILSPGGRPGFQSPQFVRGSQPPQVGLQRSANESHEFDFGPPNSSSPATSPNISQRNSKGLHQPSEEVLEQLESLKNDVRILSVELAESARRELNLPKKHTETEDSSKPDQAEALAKAHSELSLERAKREAALKAIGGDQRSSVELHENLADLEYRHSEVVHLLSTRTEQYDSLKQRFSCLEEDYNKQQQESDAIVARSKEGKVSQQNYEQDEQLKAQLSILEQENAKLRSQLDQHTARGPLGGRVTALEDQRSALQDALRAMRERKDAEIRALNNRIEMLTINQTRQRNASSGSAVSSTVAARTPSVSSLLISKDGNNKSISTSPTTANSDEGQLTLPRIRNSSLTRPASPLHLGLDYNR